MAGQSISRAQAAAIADGFLNTLAAGTQDGELVPRESLGALMGAAADIITHSLEILASTGTNSSGYLSGSLKVRPPVMTGGAIRVEIEAAEYFKFINAGVKGTRSGRSTAGFQFRSSNPSGKMVSAIEKWLETSHKVTVNQSPKHSISANERKHASLSQYDVAYTIARSILRKGIKPTNFLDKAVQMAEQALNENLGTAFKIDVLNALPNSLAELSKGK